LRSWNIKAGTSTVHPGFLAWLAGSFPIDEFANSTSTKEGIQPAIFDYWRVWMEILRDSPLLGWVSAILLGRNWSKLSMYSNKGKSMSQFYSPLLIYWVTIFRPSSGSQYRARPDPLLIQTGKGLAHWHSCLLCLSLFYLPPGYLT
jgi:hypothetical protein